MKTKSYTKSNIYCLKILFKRPTSYKPTQNSSSSEITQNIYPKKLSPPSGISSVYFSSYEPYFSLVTLQTVQRDMHKLLWEHRFCTVLLVRRILPGTTGRNHSCSLLNSRIL